MGRLVVIGLTCISQLIRNRGGQDGEEIDLNEKYNTLVYN